MPASKSSSKKKTSKSTSEGEPDNERSCVASQSDTSPQSPSQKGSAQTRIDSLFKSTESASDISAALNSLKEKLDRVASQEFVENQFKKMISEELLTKKLDNIKKEIATQILKEVKHINQTIEKIVERVEKLDDRTVELEGRVFDMGHSISKLEESNTKLEMDNSELRNRVSELKYAEQVRANELNELQQYTRRNSIRIYGIDDPDKSEASHVTSERVIKLLNNELGMTVQPRDIDITHRMGRFNPSGNRPIICKFVSRTVKIQTINMRRKLKGKAVVIREDLTIKNAKLLEKVSTLENV